MNITENKLQQIIIEELKEVLGMDQEYTGSEMDVDAENDLAGALMALQKAGYSREEVLAYVDDAYGVTSDSGKAGSVQEAIEDLEWEGPPGINDFDGGVQIVNSRHGTDVFLNDRLVATGFFDHSADAFFMERSSKSFNSMPQMAAHYGQQGLEMQREDFFSDSAKEEEAEAKQRAAQGETDDKENDPGQYVTTSKGCPDHTRSGAKIRVKVK